MKHLKIGVIVVLVIALLYVLFISYSRYQGKDKTIEEYRQEFQDCIKNGGKSIPGSNPLIGSCELNGKKYYYEG